MVEPVLERPTRRVSRPTCAAVAVVAAAACLAAQAAPSTEIFLATFRDGPPKSARLGPVTFQGEGLEVGTPVNITNNPGYDNQPEFLPDSSGVLFASNRDGKQTDIYRYDITSKTLGQLTHTDDNEYSPTIAPGGRTFTTVRGADQRLWRFNLDGSDAGLAYAHRGKIGYHVWTGPTTLAAFILAPQDGAPNTLELIDAVANIADVVDTQIGRSLKMRPDGGLTYVRKAARDDWEIRELNLATRKSAFLVKTVPGSEDCVWTPDSALVMGAGSKLYFWVERNEDRWVEFADLKGAGVTTITRLAVSPDGKWIAIVGMGAAK